LNPTIYEAYKDKADLVIHLNPDEPGEIPVGKNDPEPESIKKEMLEKIVHKYPSLQVFDMCLINYSFFLIFFQIMVPIVLGSVALLFLIIVILFCRLRHMNWLNKLERFKTEHLFHAYQKSQNAKKISKQRLLNINLHIN
jgi:hypothetical protein